MIRVSTKAGWRIVFATVLIILGCGTQEILETSGRTRDGDPGIKEVATLEGPSAQDLPVIYFAATRYLTSNSGYRLAGERRRRKSPHSCGDRKAVLANGGLEFVGAILTDARRPVPGFLHGDPADVPFG